jgi:hypothetical protein
MASYDFSASNISRANNNISFMAAVNQFFNIFGSVRRSASIINKKSPLAILNLSRIALPKTYLSLLIMSFILSSREQVSNNI